MRVCQFRHVPSSRRIIREFYPRGNSEVARFYNHLGSICAKVNTERFKGGMMAEKATGTYGIKSWDEKTWDGKDYKDRSGAKLTHAKIVFTFQGEVEGEVTAQLVMAYRNETF